MTTKTTKTRAPRAKIISTERNEVAGISAYCGIHSAALVEFQVPVPTLSGRKPTTPHRFWVLLHGAYNAYGLIGTEFNGVAVLDADRRLVLADELAPRASLGWYEGTGGSPSPAQLETFKHLTTCSWNQFRNTINCSGRNRYTLEG